MPDRPDCDDIDLFVGGVTPEPGSHDELLKAIVESRSRPEHAAQLREAARILSEIGAERLASGMNVLGSTAERWQQCIDDLARKGSASAAVGREVPKSAEAVTVAVASPRTHP